MNELTQIPDTTRLASEQDKLQALASLATLPAQRSYSAEQDEINDRAMLHALEGVPRYALMEAVHAVLKGALGHTFFPSPVELRQQCDKAMEPHIRQAERIRVQEIQERERAEYARSRQGQTPAARTRVAAAYAKFCAGYTSEKEEAEEVERADIRSHYGMTDELINAIPDQPVPSNFKKLGVR